VQIPEPHGRVQIVWVERESAFESALRHFILAEHEGGNTGTKAKARVVGPESHGFGERIQGDTESPLLDGGGALTGQSAGVVLFTTVGGDVGANRQQRERDKKQQSQGNSKPCKNATSGLLANLGCSGTDSAVVPSHVYKSRRHGCSWRFLALVRWRAAFDVRCRDSAGLKSPADRDLK
jgi:hypothetical protein